MSPSPSKQDKHPKAGHAALEQRLRDQRDQLTAALAALEQLATPSAEDVQGTLATLRDTSVQLNDALQLADDLAAWCATFEASLISAPSHLPTAPDTPAWLEPLQAWAQPKQWTLRGHAPRWQLGMISVIQPSLPQGEDVLEVWLGDKQERIGHVPADGHALTASLDAFLQRPLPAGFTAALQDSINRLAADQPAAPVRDVFARLEQHLADALPASYPPAAFAYDLYRVKTTANLRFIAASRAHKQRLWIPQDTQGRGMVCGWLAC